MFGGTRVNGADENVVHLGSRQPKAKDAAFYQARDQWVMQVTLDAKNLPMVALALGNCLALRYSNLGEFLETGHLVAWPSIGTLATELGFAERSVQYGLGALRVRGHIVSDGTDSLRRTVRHRLAVSGNRKGAKSCTPLKGAKPCTPGGAKSRSKGVQGIAPDSLEDSSERKQRSKSALERAETAPRPPPVGKRKRASGEAQGSFFQPFPDDTAPRKRTVDHCELTPQWREAALGYRRKGRSLAEDRLEEVFGKWKRSHQSKGTLSANWDALWIDGIDRRLEWDEGDTERQRREEDQRRSPII